MTIPSFLTVAYHKAGKMQVIDKVFNAGNQHVDNSITVEDNQDNGS